MKVDHLGDLAQREFLIEVETEHRPLDLGNSINPGRQQPFQFRAFKEAGRRVVLPVGDVTQQVSGAFAGGILQTGDVQAAGFHQPLMVFVERNAELERDFLFGWTALETLLGLAHGGFDLFGFAAFLPGSPIQAAQAVEDGPANLVFGVGFQLHVEARVEVINRRDQAQHTGRDQVFQADVFRQPLLNPPRDEPHLGQVLQNQPLAFFFADHLRRHRGIHRRSLFCVGLLRPPKQPGWRACRGAAPPAGPT